MKAREKAHTLGLQRARDYGEIYVSPSEARRQMVASARAIAKKCAVQRARREANAYVNTLRVLADSDSKHVPEGFVPQFFPFIRMMMCLIPGIRFYGSDACRSTAIKFAKNSRGEVSAENLLARVKRINYFKEIAWDAMTREGRGNTNRVLTVVKSAPGTYTGVYRHPDAGLGEVYELSGLDKKSSDLMDALRSAYLENESILAAAKARRIRSRNEIQDELIREGIESNPGPESRPSSTGATSSEKSVHQRKKLKIQHRNRELAHASEKEVMQTNPAILHALKNAGGDPALAVALDQLNSADARISLPGAGSTVEEGAGSTCEAHRPQSEADSQPPPMPAMPVVCFAGSVRWRDGLPTLDDEVLPGDGERVTFTARWECGSERVFFTPVLGGMYSIPMKREWVAAGCRAVPPSLTKQGSVANVQRALNAKRSFTDHFEKNPGDVRAVALIPLSIVCMVHVAPASLDWLFHYNCQIPQMYQVFCADEARERAEARFSFAADWTEFQCSWAKSAVLGPYHVHGIDLEIPDASDVDTLKAGLAKRLCPVIHSDPKWRSDWSSACNRVIFSIMNAAKTTPEDFDEAEALDSFLAGHTLGQQKEMRAGVEMAREDPNGALEWYLSLPYKCFVKKEVYLRTDDGKPPRFIMSLPEKARGIQFFFMARILHRIEQLTACCNVKHRTSQAITEMVRRKFELAGEICETDFTSCESNITPEVKKECENKLFRCLAEEMGGSYRKNAIQFIDRALARDCVQVRHKVFKSDEFPHIRMSGDLWTSIGNLVFNLCTCYYAKCAADNVQHDPASFMAESLFEGDDGLFLPPKNITDMGEAATKAGFLLKFEVGAWNDLNFCGNHFYVVGDELVRSRDPDKTLASLSVVFSPDQFTSKHLAGLQRSKCLSCLCGDWVPRASVFAACVERLTKRDCVRRAYLLNTGRLRAFSPHADERCLPDWCRLESDSAWAAEVAARERSAGGEISRREVLHVFQQLHDTNECEFAVGVQDRTSFLHAFIRGPRRLALRGLTRVRSVTREWDGVLAVHGRSKVWANTSANAVVAKVQRVFFEYVVPALRRALKIALALAVVVFVASACTKAFALGHDAEPPGSCATPRSTRQIVRHVTVYPADSSYFRTSSGTTSSPGDNPSEIRLPVYA